MSCEKLKDGEQWQTQTFDLVAKANSVRVEWGTVGKVGKGSGQTVLDKERLLSVMGEYPDTWLSVSSLAEAIGKTDNYTRNLLAELVREGKCKRKLADTTKPQSNRNPWVYSFA
jgi:hypothetical protein